MKKTTPAVAVALMVVSMIAAAATPIGAADDNEQFTFFEDDLTHTPTSYAEPSAIGGPSNWESPVDYAHGRVYARVEVTEKPSNKKLGVQLCMWRDSFGQETCSQQKFVRTEGIYWFNLGKPSQWWKLNGVWDFDRPVSPVRLMVKDPGRRELMMTSSCGAACYTGPLDLDDHTPVEMSASVVVVAKGDNLQPPAGWLGCPNRWSPLCTNRAPVVDAGHDTSITEPISAVALSGSASDETLVDPDAGLDLEWSVISGPGSVSFSNSGSVDSIATFSRTGAYRLQLTASDGAKTASDEVVVSVRPDTGGGIAKLIARRGPNPVVADRPIVTWLEELGFEVEVLDDNKATKAQLDGADIVVISSSVAPNQIKSWIADVDAPILSSEVFVAAKLGLGTKGRQFGGQRKIRLVDPTSPLAAGSDGDIAISRPGGVGGVSGVSAGVHVVAKTIKNNSDVATIVAVEKGVDLPTGEAVARRVGFFAGSDLPNKLFPEGQALFDSAVDWLVTEPVSPPPPAWWNNAWAFRETIEFDAGAHSRTEQIVETDIDFTTSLVAAGVALDSDSLRVVEIDSAGAIIDPDIAFQFDPSADFDASIYAAGRLTLLAEGETPAGTSRWFSIYFDSPAAGHPAASVTARVSVADGVFDEGQESFEIVLGDSTWLYQKSAGAFSSLIDADGSDWISYSSASGSAGEFRGIPNAAFSAGHFKPGTTTSQTKLISAGPLKAIIESTTTDGLWTARWEFFPSFARMTMVQADGPYWLLYEGTPGGSIDTADKVLRSTGARTAISQKWANDLPVDEWVAFADGASDRTLFLAHLTDDSAVDSYRLMNGEMTVFGFGRKQTNELLSGTHELVVGLTDSADKATASAVADAAASPVEVSSDGQHSRPAG